MTEANHTPGPWWVEDRRKASGKLQIQAKHRGEGSSYCIASVNEWEVPEANGRLLAAAPCLLAALKRAVRELEQYVDLQKKLGYIEYAVSTQKELDAVNTVIAKVAHD